MMSDEQKLLQEALAGLSPAERAQALEILKQYAANGSSILEADLKWADFDEIPVDITTFMHDRKYLGNGLYDSEGRFTVYPFWEETLREIFPDSVSTAYNNVVFSGAIGIGKSFVAVICVLYMLYRLLCLKDPYTYYGLQKIDKLSIAFLNITIENAKGVALDKMNQLILSSEWFMAHGEMRGTTNLMYYPEKHIEFCLASSNNQVIGRCIICSFEDEVNFATFSNPEKQKDRMMKLITQLDARMKSRFMRTKADGSSYLPTLNLIASSKDTEQSFLDAYIKTKVENESKNTLIIDKPQWVVDSRKDSPVKFYVAIGNRTLPNELLPLDITKEQLDEYEKKGYQLWKVPIGYLDTFQQNLDEAICSIIGISTASSLKFIAGDRWYAIKTDEYKNPFMRDIIKVGNHVDDHLQYSNFFDLDRVAPEDIGKPLFMHLDLSLSGDKTGIAGVWIEGKIPTIAADNINEDVDYSLDLRYKVAFSTSIEAPKGTQVSFEKTRNFIRWLRDRGFNICLISADTFNSANILQDLKMDGFKTEILSVDRVDTRTKMQQQYAYFKSAIYERRMKVYKDCELLTDEVLQLERLSNGKIEHEAGGTKGCFTGDTKVSLVDGRQLSFLELVKEYGEGKQNFVYSINPITLKIEPKPINKAWCTLKNQPLIKITLDNGEEIRCTYNHKFMLRNGVYVEANNLIAGDSLMPLYTKYPGKTKMSKYRMYYEPAEDKWHYEHRQFATEVLDEHYLVHHKNCNPQDNSPTNLVWCSKQKHQEIHNKLNTGSHSPEVNARRRQSIINWYNNPDNADKKAAKAEKSAIGHILATGLEAHNTRVEQAVKQKAIWEEKQKQWAAQKVQHQLYIKDIEQIFGIEWSKLTNKEKDSYSVKYARLKNPEIQEKISKAVSKNHKNGKYINATKALANWNTELTSLKKLFPTVDKDEFFNFFGFNYDELETASQKGVWINRYRKQKYELVNHTVTKIEYLDQYEDVYDIEVADNHNFALAAGIFVHNSKDQCDAVCGSLWDASRYAEQYAYEYGDTLLNDLAVNDNMLTSEMQKQQYIKDFEQELQSIWTELDNTEQQKNKEKQEELQFYHDIQNGIIVI